MVNHTVLTGGGKRMAMLLNIRPENVTLTLDPASKGKLVNVFTGQALAGVMWLDGSAYGRYGSGNTTIGEQSVAGVALADDDTTGLQQAQNYHISAGSIGSSLLTGNAIAAAGGEAVPATRVRERIRVLTGVVARLTVQQVHDPVTTDRQQAIRLRPIHVLTNVVRPCG